MPQVALNRFMPADKQMQALKDQEKKAREALQQLSEGQSVIDMKKKAQAEVQAKLDKVLEDKERLIQIEAGMKQKEKELNDQKAKLDERQKLIDELESQAQSNLMSAQATAEKMNKSHEALEKAIQESEKAKSDYEAEIKKIKDTLRSLAG